MSNVRQASIFIFQKNWNSTMTRIVLSELSESSIDLHQSVKLSCFWSLHGLRKVFEFRWVVVWPLNKTNRNDAYWNLIREWDQRLVHFPILIFWVTLEIASNGNNKKWKVEIFFLLFLITFLNDNDSIFIVFFHSLDLSCFDEMELI